MEEKEQLYETPRILTYSSDDILSEIGPAQACSPYWASSAPPDAPGYAPGLPPIHEPPPKKKRGSLFSD